MRIVKLLVLLLLIGVALLAGGVVQNDLPLNEPPGLPIRLATYLQTHVAETMDDSPFPELRSRHYTLAADQLYAKVKEAIALLPRWAVAESDDDGREIHAVVTSRLFRFKDDVSITVVPEPGGRPTLLVRAVSRVGQGDLGTNTRHILNLYDALERVGAHGEVERLSDAGDGALAYTLTAAHSRRRDGTLWCMGGPTLDACHRPGGRGGGRARAWLFPQRDARA